MTVIAIVLIVISTFVHAIWNLIGKREDPSPEFFLLANTFGCLCILVAVSPFLAVAGAFPARMWMLLAATGLFQAIYFSGLAGAYRAGHLSVAYPLARSAPVILVAAVSIAIGKAYQLTPQSIGGMALIVIGGLVLPIGSLSEWKMKDYLHPSSLFALMAAVGTTGYSIIDDAALRLLGSAHGLAISKTHLTLLYAGLEGVSTSLWLAVFVMLMPKHANKSAKTGRRYGSAALAGIGIFAAYALVLLAMTHARNVSYIVAFRQLSIPIGAVLGMTVLHEPHNRPRLVGIAIMLAGLVLVALK